jgi:hypothetical protein
VLTKSLFLRFVQCPKALWLAKYKKELIPEVDAVSQRTFDSGYEVEDYARQLFPKGALVEGYYEKAKKNTEKLIKEGAKILFQATAMTDDLMSMADILAFNEKTKLWDIYEVKSSTEVKEIHVYDVAFQKYCFEQAGYKIGKTHLIHVNKEYVKKGKIQPKKFLTIEDITELADSLIQEDLLDLVNEALSILNLKKEPDVRILKQCNKPYACSFIEHCWRDLPDESIYSIAGGLSEKKLNQLLDEGVLEIKGIPEELVTSKSGLRHYHSITKKEVHIEKKMIEKELSQLKFPLYFLDYETYSPTVPVFDGYKPYQRVVFQYSLHVMETPNSKIEHHEYLAKDLKDPTDELSATLQSQIGDKGSVITWNMSFEKGCNREMGERSRKYKKFYEMVNDRVYDLMNPFRQGLYVHRAFHGSASIKKVLPVLVPELSYKALDIQEGGMASESWAQMVIDKPSAKEQETIYKNLLKYCELDTLAMVRIYEKLVEL